MKCSRYRLSGLCLLMASASWGMTQAQAQDRVVSVSIAAKPAEQALQELALRTGANILFSPDTVVGIRSVRLRGAVTAEDGVRRMLAGTGLEVVRDAGGAILVQRARTAARRIARDDAPSSAAASTPIRYAALQTSVPVASAAPTQASEPQTAPAPGQQEIIVTAQRRSERLEDVPISITALNGSDLTKSGKTSRGSRPAFRCRGLASTTSPRSAASRRC